MAGHAPEESVRSQSLRQRWTDVTFLHWRYDPLELQRLLPSRVTVEEIDGSSWIGMVLFLAQDSRLGGLLPIHGGADIPETNVRTYVRLPSGADAVWFFSLDVASRTLAVLGRGLLDLPYRTAQMSVHRRGGDVEYESRRAGVGHRVVVRPSGGILPTGVRARDAQLTGRWRAVVPRGAGRLCVPVVHEPWPLERAELVHLDEDLLAQVGLTRPKDPPEVRWSAGVGARVGWPRRR